MKLGLRRTRPPSALHPTRVERSAQERRDRAQEHLQRVRNRGEVHAVALALPSWRAALVVLVAALGVGAVAGTPLLSATSSWLRAGEPPRVFVRGAVHVAPSEVVRASELLDGADASPESVAARVRTHPWIESARVATLASGTLLIEVSERVPEAVVSLPGEEQLWFVDASGTAFAPAPPTGVDLPTLRPTETLAPGSPHASLGRAISLAARISRSGLSQLSEITISSPSDPEGFAIRLKDLPPLIVLGWDDFEPGIERLVRLLAADVAEVATAESLDLRFADQVVLRGALHREGAEQAAVGRGRAGPSTPQPPG